MYTEHAEHINNLKKKCIVMSKIKLYKLHPNILV